MLGRKRGHDPVSLAAACLRAMAVNDRETLNRLDPAFRKLSAEQILGALGQLGQMIKPAIKPEQREVILAALENAPGQTAITRPATVAIGTALLIDADPKKAAQEVARQAAKIAESGEDLTAVVMGCFMATASVVAELDIKFAFK